MGSTGSGNFSDYSGRAGGSSASGKSMQDRCATAFNTDIEDVATSPYYKRHQQVPPLGTPLKIEAARRLEVKDEEGLLVGYLPTGLHYLFTCIDSGYSYEGVVAASSPIPIPTVNADFAPQ